MPSHNIIDNRTVELAPKIVELLSDSVRAHFCVGYFFLSGFEAIAAEIPRLEQFANCGCYGILLVQGTAF